ncbi:MAG: hypothetical protein ACTSRP_05905 [Candidatus Helarchaeota archaeon]
MGKKNQVEWKSELDEDALKLAQIDYGAKFIATIDHKKRPHITFILSNRAKTSKQLVWGQFVEGTSKKNVLNDPKQGILIMTAEAPFKFVQMKVELEEIKKEGEDIEYFSRTEFYRYNCYTNVHTAYYNSIKAAIGVRNLSILGILKGILINLIGTGIAKSKNSEKKLPNLGYKLFNGPLNPKFIAYIDKTDGFPIILPCFQIRAPDYSKIIFPLSQFKSELNSFQKGDQLAVYVMNFEPIMLHINGKFLGYKKYRGIKYGLIDIEEVYNPMPPLSGIIYPELQTRPKVQVFTL